MRKTTKWLAIVVCIFIFFTVMSFVSLAILIAKPSTRQYILKKISSKIGYPIHVKNIKLSFSHGVGISIYKVNGGSKKDPFIFSCPKIFVLYKISDLIKGKPIPEKLLLLKPKIIINNLKIPSNNKKPINNKKIFFLIATFSHFSIKDAIFKIRNIHFDFSHMNIDLKRKGLKKMSFLIDTMCIREKYQFPLYIRGMLSLMQNRQIKTHVDVNTKGFPLNLIFIKDILSFLDGSVNAHITLDIDSNKNAKVMGQLKLKDMDMILEGTDNQKKEYRFANLNIDLYANYSNKLINCRLLKIKGKDFRLDAYSKIDLNRDSPFISLNVTSPFMPFRSFKKIFPSCLLPDWLENRLFSILTKGRVKVSSFSINGTADQINNIDNPQNRDVLSGLLVIKDLCLFPNNAEYPVENIRGFVSLKNGNLLIKNIEASFASSFIKDAEILIKNVYQDNRHYYINVDGSFSLADLMSQIKMEFTPKDIINATKDLKDVSGRMTVHLNCEYKESWQIPIFNNSSALITNTHILYKKIPLIYIKQGKFWIDSKSNYYFDGKGKIGKSKLKLFLGSDAAFKQLSIDLSGDLYVYELLGDIFKRYKIEFNGPIGVKLHIKNIKSKWTAQGDIFLRNSPSIKISRFFIRPCSSKLNFSLKYIPSKYISFDYLKFRARNSSFYARGKYTLKTKILSVNLLTNGLYLESFGIRCQDIKEPIKGRILCKLKANISFNNPLLYTFIYGFLKISAFSIKYSKVPVNINNGYIKFLGNRFEIVPLNINLDNYPLHIKAKLKGWEGLKGDIFARFDYMDLPKLKLLLGLIADKNNVKDKKDNFLKKSELNISLLISKGKCKSILVRPIKAQFFLKNGDVNIPYIIGSLPSGIIKIKAYIKNGGKKIPAEVWMDSDVKVKDMPIENIFDCIGIKKYIDGKLYMKLHLYAKARQFNNIISHLNGKAIVLVKKGKIYKAQPILKILDFFSISNIFKNPLDIFESGVPFKAIKVKAEVKNGIIKSDKMFLESNALNAAAKGTLNLVKQSIDMGIAVQPLSTVDSIISKLPLVGYIIGGKDKKITLYYFKIKGPFNNVEIKQTPIKNLVNGTLNLFKRILLSPVHIFENMDKDIDEIDKEVGNIN